MCERNALWVLSLRRSVIFLTVSLNVRSYQPIRSVFYSNTSLFLKYTLYQRKTFQTKRENVGFEVFTGVVMKSIIFWDMTPYSPLSFNRRFGGTYRLHLKQQAGLLNLFLHPWRWRRYVPTERRLKLNGLHRLISQKTILFKTREIRVLPKYTFLDDYPFTWSLMKWLSYKRTPGKAVRKH
jgi:hypothetical protein